MQKRKLGIIEIWNLSFGFLGIQMGFALQNANASRILQNFGADVHQLSWFWIIAPLMGLIVQPIVGHYSDKTWTKLGRRRPYFLIGALLASVGLILMPQADIFIAFLPALWVGAGIAGIKLHGAIDAIIQDNRINNSLKGIWLDWMTQGTRITGNLIYDIYLEDLFVEVNHGPFTVDNNLLLSNSVGILDGSGGGAYVHNLVNGKIVIVQQDRNTPYHKPHSTVVLGRAITKNADNRYYNNWFTSVDRMVNEQMPNGWWIDRGSYGLGIYQGYSPMYVDGNIYFMDAEPFPKESNQLKVPGLNPRIRLEERENEVYLYVNFDSSILSSKAQLIDTELLGRAKVSEMWFENKDGSPLVIDRDYFGYKRNKDKPVAGPFEPLDTEMKKIKIWPKTNRK